MDDLVSIETLLGTDKLEKPAVKFEEYISKELLSKQFEKLLHPKLSALEEKNRAKAVTIIIGSEEYKLTPENRVNIDVLIKHTGTALEGRFFVGCCITNPMKLTAIMTLLEDPEAKAGVRLALYNYSSRTESNLSQFPPVGTFLAIMNPLLMPTADEGAAIRVDNPKDLIVLSREHFDSLLPDLKSYGEIYPPKLSKKDEEAVVKFKNSGNKSFVGHKYVTAIGSYTKGLEIDPTNVDLLSNRAAAYIEKSCYNKAFVDTTAVLEIDPFHIKGIYRCVKSLWGLNRYKEATELLDRKFSENSELKKSKELVRMTKMAEKMLKQNETGDFDMLEIVSGGYEKTLETAEFTGPVKIAMIEGKGRGLVTTEAVKAGQLLICSRAFASTYCSSPKMGIHHNTLYVPRDTVPVTNKKSVIKTIAEKLRLDPQLGREVFQLYAGPELGSLTSDDEKTQELDKTRIERVVTLNAFEKYESTDELDDDLYLKSLDKCANIARNGVFILPSYINHSCSDANCFWDLRYDMIFIRAVKPIAEGEEVLISYISPTTDYESRKKLLEIKGFVCDCSGCSLEGNEAEGIRRRRSNILKALEKNKVHWGFGRTSIINQDLAKISKLEAFEEAKAPGRRISLADTVVLELAHQFHYHIGDNRKCIEIFEKAHVVMKETGMAKDALDVSMEALRCLLHDDDDCVCQMNKTILLIDKWYKIIKEDLLIAYGSLEPFRFLGNIMMEDIEELGIPFFD